MVDVWLKRRNCLGAGREICRRRRRRRVEANLLRKVDELESRNSRLSHVISWFVRRHAL